MAKTQRQLIDEARYRLDERREGFYENRELCLWINEATRDIARRSRCLRATDSVTVVADTQAYTQAADVLSPLHCSYVPTGDSSRYPLEYVDQQSMNQYWGIAQSNTGGMPSYWTMWGTAPALQIKLWPTPSIGGTLYVDHYRLPAELDVDGTDNNVAIDLPSGWEDLVLDYMMYRAKLKEGDVPAAEQARVAYENNLRDLSDMAVRWTDHPGRINAEVGYMGPHFDLGDFL